VLSLVVVPSLVFIIATYIVGYVKLKTLLLASAAANNSALAPERQRAVRHIGQTSYSLTFLLIFFVASIITFVATGAWSTGVTPQSQPASVANAIVWITASIIILIVLRYCALSVLGRLGKGHSTKPSSNNSNSLNANKASTRLMSAAVVSAEADVVKD